MNSDKGWYWLAAGVLALGLVHTFDGVAGDWVRQAKDTSLCAAQQVSSRFVSQVENLSGRSGVASPEFATQVAARVARAQAEMARRQATMARFQSKEIRLAAQKQAQRTIAVCPRQGLRLHPPRIILTPGDGTI